MTPDAIPSTASGHQGRVLRWASGGAVLGAIVSAAAMVVFPPDIYAGARAAASGPFERALVSAPLEAVSILMPAVGLGAMGGVGLLASLAPPARAAIKEAASVYWRPAVLLVIGQAFFDRADLAVRRHDSAMAWASVVMMGLVLVLGLTLLGRALLRERVDAGQAGGAA